MVVKNERLTTAEQQPDVYAAEAAAIKICLEEIR